MGLEHEGPREKPQKKSLPPKYRRPTLEALSKIKAWGSQRLPRSANRSTARAHVFLVPAGHSITIHMKVSKSTTQRQRYSFRHYSLLFEDLRERSISPGQERSESFAAAATDSSLVVQALNWLDSEYWTASRIRINRYESSGLTFYLGVDDSGGASGDRDPDNDFNDLLIDIFMNPTKSD